MIRAVQASDPGSVALVEVPEPEPGPAELVIDVVAAAICNTDRKLVARGTGGPRTLGHEVVGRLADGTLVGVHPEVSCRRCSACLAGWENRCPDRISVGIGRDGGLAEQLLVPRDRVVPIAPVDASTGALLEPLATVVHAVELARMPAEARALVIGGGAMGILAAWVLATRTLRVALLQRSEPRRQIAVDLGIDPVVSDPGDVEDALGGSPDLALVTAPGAEPLRQALELVSPGGTVHAFAGTPGGASIDANLVHYRHLTLIGSTGSRLGDYQAAHDLVASGAVPLDRMPHRTVTLEEVPEVLTTSEAPTVLKTIVTIGS